MKHGCFLACLSLELSLQQQQPGHKTKRKIPVKSFQPNTFLLELIKHAQFSR